MRRICLPVLFMLCLLDKGQSTTIHIGPSYQVKSLKEGLKIAFDQDSLVLNPGTYFEHGLVVDKEVHIIGIDYPIIDGGSEGEILTVISNNVIIEGIQVQNVGTSYLKDHAGIRIKRVHDVILRNNRLENTFFGIYLEHTKNSRIESNVIHGNAIKEAASGNGIHAWYCDSLEIINNIITRHRDGIYFEFVNNSRIIGNTSKNNLRYGLHFMFSNHDKYHHNRFSENGAGVAVMFSKYIDMWDNHFIHNWGGASYGLLLKEIYDAKIVRNTFQKNTSAIHVEGSSRIEYNYNNFQNNGWAIRMAGGCLQNTIHQNNFIGNTMDLVLNSRINDNNFNGNYWSTYNGYDLDRNGIGDIPHYPVKLFSYIVDQVPESIILLRSFFIELLNFSEKISPALTPSEVLDNSPLIQPVKYD